MLQHWTGEWAQLETFDSMIVDFMWSGQDTARRHRVSYAAICRPILHGGLGVISVRQQAIAKAGMTMLWVPQEGEDTLKCILREKVADLSERRWGTRDYSWLLVPCRTLPHDESALWTNLCKSWNLSKREIELAPLANWKERMPVAHRDRKRVVDITVRAKLLRFEGINILKDMVDPQCQLIQWKDRSTPLPETLAAAYRKLCANLDVDASKVVQQAHLISIFVTEGRMSEGSIVWEIRCPRGHWMDRYRTDDALPTPIATYKHTHGVLQKVEPFMPEQDSILGRIIVGLPRTDSQGKKQLTYIGKMDDAIAASERYQWKGGREIFNTTTFHMRLQRNKLGDSYHMGILMWEQYTTWRPHPTELWSLVWQSFLGRKHCCFLWQILHRSVAINQWRFQMEPDSDGRKHCKQCNSPIVEDVNHTLWHCPRTWPIWDWVSFMLPLTSDDPTQLIQLTECQALMGEPLNASPMPPPKWWVALRSAAL